MKILFDVFGELLEPGNYVFWRKDGSGCCKLMNWPYLSEELRSKFSKKLKIIKLSQDKVQPFP